MDMTVKELRRVMRTLSFGTVLILCASSAFAVTAVHGTVRKIDSTAKTIVVKTTDGTEHTFHFLGSTVVHGAEEASAGTKDTFHGLGEGSEVLVHYTTEGTEKTAVEVDHVGKDGLKVAEGTITALDQGSKTIAIKTASGTAETFHLTAHATEDAGMEIARGSEKSTKVTVFYTEEGGRKVAHFFRKAL
jgi:hypothetical protein